MKKIFLIIMAFLLFLITFNSFLPVQHVRAASDYWPATEWCRSTPEEQGVDSVKLLRMMQYIRENNLDIHSVIIIRHGFMVLESYLAPYGKDTIHNLKSVSKSVLSALTGIALQKKLLAGLDQKVADFYPEYFGASDDQRKKEITLKHLLTMSAGFTWEENSPASDRMWRSADWVKYAIEIPLANRPGAKFTYSTALTHLMSAILTKTSGMSTRDFALQNLFDSMGVTVGLWRRDPQGIYLGGWELFLTPRDMAKFGYLYLKRGIWNGVQLVPAEWVAESTREQISTGNWGGYPRYGYWWWLQSDSYSAEGWGGQRIVVIPDQDAVVVFTSADFNAPRELYESFIKPALKPGVLAPRPKTVAALAQLNRALEHPRSKPVPPLTKTQRDISGKIFKLEPNNLGITGLELRFTGRRSKKCQLILEASGGKLEVPVGLDGLYRTGNIGGDLPIAARGSWEQMRKGVRGGRAGAAGTFLIDWLNVGEPLRSVCSLNFDADDLLIVIQIKPTGEYLVIRGKSGDAS